MKFRSFHAEGAGNAFILLEGSSSPGREDECRMLHAFAESAQAGEFAQTLARDADAEGRPCDGLLFALPPRDEESDLRFIVWNRDGSRAGACGNGLRCVARRAFRTRGFEEGELRIETDRGSLRARLGASMVGAKAHEIHVEIGPAIVAPAEQVHTLSGPAYCVHSVDVGNPQAVVLTSLDPTAGITTPSSRLRELRLDRGPLFAAMGRELQLALPGGPNVALGAIEGRVASLRVYERGVGETRSCGTGAVALAAVGRALGLVEDSLRIVQRGGTLLARLEGSSWWLGGPTRVDEFTPSNLGSVEDFLRAKPVILG